MVSVLAVVAAAGIVAKALPYRVHDIFYDLCVAYAAAWLFNFLVVVLPRLRTEELVLIGLRKPLQGVTGAALAPLREMARQVHAANPHGPIQPLPDPPPPLTKRQIQDICAAVDVAATHPNAITAVGGRYLTWAEYLASDARRRRRSIAYLEPAYPMLDGELVAAIQAIATSSYLSMVEIMAGVPTRDLDFLGQSLHDLYEKCQKLTRYFDRVVRPLTDP